MNRNVRHARNLFTTGAILALVATGCGENGESAGNELDEITLGSGIENLGPEWAAATSVPQANDYWADRGLDVTIATQNGSGQSLQLLDQGEIDATIVGSAAGYPLKEQGSEITWVANILSQNTNFPVVSGDSSINSVEDFAGARIGVPSLQSTQHLWMTALLDREGMTEDDLAGVVSVASTGQAAHAIETGEIDVLFWNTGEYARMEVLQDIDLRPIAQDHALFQENPGVLGVWVRDETLEENPEEIETLLKGMTEGYVYTATNPEASVALHYGEYPEAQPQGMPIEEAIPQNAEISTKYIGEATFEAAKTGEWGRISNEEAQNLAVFLEQSGQIESVEPGDFYYDPRLLDAANDVDVTAIEEAAMEDDWEEIVAQ